MLSNEIKHADVVLVCYDMFLESQSALFQKYLPFVTACNPKVPIVIVGTKLDKYMRETNANKTIELEDSEYWG